MDILLCEATLDNSFQKDKLELVNKGSLGRRRKPSRANIKNILSPSNNNTEFPNLNTTFLNSINNILQSRTSTFERNKITQDKNTVLQNSDIIQQKSIIHQSNDISVLKHITLQNNDVTQKNHIALQNNVNSQNHITLQNNVSPQNNITLQNDVNTQKNHINLQHEDTTQQNHISLLNDDITKPNPNTPQTEITLQNHIASESHNITDAQNHSVTLQNKIIPSENRTKLTNGVVSKTRNTLQNHNSTRQYINTPHNYTPQNHKIPPHKNIVTPQLRTSTPVPSAAASYTCNKKLAVNGHVKSDTFIKNNLKPHQANEPTLIRTSPEPNHVADAQQFSIEAKLKQKQKSDVGVGRSAVLIQTWERRTWSDSLTKQKRETSRSVPTTCERCGNKENTFRGRDMPEPQRYPGGNPRNAGSVQKGGFRPRTRDSNDTMLYRVPDSGPKYIKQWNGRKPTTASQEPEWISLSKKLCAKFVEGYIEPNSADSYIHEEPEGVKEQPEEASEHRPRHQTRVQGSIPQKRIVEEQKPKKKVTEDMAPVQNFADPNNGSEPPWVHLSRKLCTKFIEEHIEYPVAPTVEPSKKALLVEPNGDVRIIEKVGQAKERKSKGRKESEPEWVSISRKLRAKFIESHIDDPDTISMDNQLNASDPELSSESLSDNSQDTIISKKATSSDLKCADYYERKIEKSQANNAHKNRFQNTNYNSSPFYEKDDSYWEHQEMDFDQESNSGTFLDAEFSEDSINECKKTPTLASQNRNQFASEEQNDKLKFGDEYNGRFISFAETLNSRMFCNAECYNNDVLFASRNGMSSKSNGSNSERNKNLTLNYVPHRGKSNQECNKRNQLSPDNNNNAFFNLTTWEEAHSQSPNVFKLKNELRSKSMNNICDSDDVCDSGFEKCKGKQATHVNHHDNLPLTNSKTNFKSEDVLDKLECKISTRNAENRTRKIGCFEDSVYKTRIDQFSGHSEIFEVGVQGANVLRSTSSDSFESFEVAPESYESNTEPFAESENENLKEVNKKEKDTLKTHSIQMSRYNKKDNSEFNQRTQSSSNLESSTQRETLENFVNYVNGESIHLHQISTKKANRNEHDRHNVYETHENDDSVSRCTQYSEKHNNTSNSCKSYKITNENSSSSKDVKNNKHLHIQSIEPQKSEVDVSQKQNSKVQHNSENSTITSKEQKPTGMKKHYKCNGAIPNAKKTKSNENVKTKGEENIPNGNQSEYENLTKNDKVSSSKPEKSHVNEYANISTIIADRQTHINESNTMIGKKSKSVHSIFHAVCDDEEHDIETKEFPKTIPVDNYNDSEHNKFNETSITGSNHGENNDSMKHSNIKIKSQSMYDLSKEGSVFKQSIDTDEKRKHQVTNGNTSNGITKSRNGSVMMFQEFESETDIPLCAKLVSKHNGKHSARSVSASSNRNSSPCSETSHVYEDMFKETTSCPSDSETSSWTVMKNNSYYINGRSSSMNDLDMSDSCSMSVKCDYASSGSENSTLQSRHSSVTSSSFYVNLRDYDSHMLEPSLNRKKKDQKKSTSNGKQTKVSNSNPPTPESLRHLFTSPFHSIHSSANRTAQLISRMPQEPESHYYSTAAATSSAFKHGFDPTPPKQKKTERSSSVKIKDIAQGIILTFRRFQNHSKSTPNISTNQGVDVSHLAESNHTDFSKPKSKKEQKEASKKQEERRRWRFSSETSRTDSDSGCHLTPSDIHGPKARRSSSDLSGSRSKTEIVEKKKSKSGKKVSNARDKKKTRSKSIEPRPISTVSRKVQQMPDGTLYLVTTVSGDTALPGVYSDSPDSSSELSTHRPVKVTGESNC